MTPSLFDHKKYTLPAPARPLRLALRALCCAGLVLLPAFLPAQTEKAVIDRVVATVGSEILLLSEVQEQLSYARQQQADLPEAYSCVIVQNLLVQKLLVHQAKIDSVEVKDEEVENQLEARIERLRQYFNQDEKAIEEYYGQNVNEIKEQMRGDMRSQLLAERMQGQITEKATITPSEVQAFFSNIPKDSLPYFNSEVEVREIIYKPQVNAVEKAKARLRLEELRQRIAEGGENFAELAKKYSEDPGSGSNGGDLGWQKRGALVPEFEAAAYKLEPEQISQIVETEFGFHLIQLLERRGNLLHARHILIKPQITDDDLSKAEARLDSIRQLILSNNISFTVAVKLFGDKNTPSYNNDGRVANPRTGNTFFEVADLDTNIFFAIDGLNPGDVTEPVPFRAPDGARYFRLIQLQSRSKPHKADLKQDYNKIQSAALEQKKGEYLERWVLDKLRSTFLSVGDLYRGCPNLQLLLSKAPTQRP
ncbi:MAG: peptidylprolyl isomerase [Saprospirales bacterium]|nr:peptidylprolyl isomerase [Saprospirales bacterium]MBK8924135.1 peptidylprolyl isomerase [Saprospirales bacterium]